MAEAEAFATPSSVPDLIAFTLFPKLPVEIQLKIWKLTMPGPRIVSALTTPD
jgi:2EXR family